MKWWKRLFQKRNTEQFQDDWEEIVYARDQVNFAEEEQRVRYITGCLEQMQEASWEIDLLTGEYSRVTAYLTDMEEIEALPTQEREEINRIANQLTVLEQERRRYREKKNKMSDGEYYEIRKLEHEMEEGIRKLTEAEAYRELIQKDLKRLSGERHAYAYRKSELSTMKANLRGMCIIFLTALVVCLGFLAVLQFAFEMKVFAGYFVAVLAAAIAITASCIKYMDADREALRVERTINKLILLQNKVKIRYVNNTQLLEYLCMKYNTTGAAKLKLRWELYLQEKEERKQYAEAEAKTEYYQKALVEKLSCYRISDPARWISQVSALLDKREMVEIRHELILRRQALRKQMDYNHDVAETAQREILDVARQYPAYAREIEELMDRFERT